MKHDMGQELTLGRIAMQGFLIEVIQLIILLRASAKRPRIERAEGQMPSPNTFRSDLIITGNRGAVGANRFHGWTASMLIKKGVWPCLDWG